MKKRNLPKSALLSGAIVVAVVATAAWLWFSPSGAQPAPQLEVTRLDGGQKIQLAELRGRPVLVTFWATSCPGCIKEMPHLIELYHELAPRGLEIIGIAMAYDKPNHVMEMQKDKQIPYPIVWDGMSEAARAFGGVRLTPSHFLINPEGQIVKHTIGEIDINLLHAQVLAMLNRQKG